jgi:hypothetical protein
VKRMLDLSCSETEIRMMRLPDRFLFDATVARTPALASCMIISSLCARRPKRSVRHHSDFVFEIGDWASVHKRCSFENVDVSRVQLNFDRGRVASNT